MNTSTRGLITPDSPELKRQFGKAKEVLGELFISPLEVNHWLPISGTQHHDADITIMIGKMQSIDFAHLKAEGGLLVAGPATAMTIRQVFDLANVACSTQGLELELLPNIRNHPRLAKVTIDAHRWILIPRTMAKTEFMAMNPALVLYAELMQLLVRDNKYPLVIEDKKVTW